MENFRKPSFLLANWTEDRLLTVIQPGTQLALMAVQDVGAAAAAVFAHPAVFDQLEVELAGDYLALRDIAAVLSEAWGTPIAAPTYTPEQAIAQGILPLFVSGQQWLNEVGSPARPAQAQRLGLPTTSFRTWANHHLKPVLEAS